MKEIGFKKTTIQKRATKLLTSEAKHILLYGGSRSGKTFLLIYSMIVRALKVKSRHVILRYRFNHVKQSIWLDTLPKVMDVAFPGLRQRCDFNKSDFYVTLPNGSEIWIGGLDDKERTEKILGNEYSTIYFNEASQLNYDGVSITRTRLAEKNDLVKKFYYDENPPKKRHWSYRMFIDHKDPETAEPLDKERFVSMLMNPADNINNLDPDYIKELESLPEMKRRRFLYGEFLDDDMGSLFKYKWIKRQHETLKYDRIVIGIDPAVSTEKGSDETGIIVVAQKGDFGYVLEDKSGKYTPEKWASIAVNLYYKYEANMIIGEVNNGGNMVGSTISNIDKNVPFKAVRATKGKYTRAEPISMLYEKGRIYHY